MSPTASTGGRGATSPASSTGGRGATSPVSSADERVGLMDGAAALPRKNGELVFEAPWEGRVFGMAVALSDQRLYAWNEFRARLVDEIAAADAASTASTYYERWLAAFESLLTARGLLTPAELDARAAEYASGQREDHDGDG